MLSIAIVSVQIDVIGLRRLHVFDTAHDCLKAGLGFQLAVDEDVTHAGRRIGMIFDFRRRPRLRVKNVAGILSKFALALSRIERLIFMRVAAITKQNRHGTRAFGNLIFVHRAGGNIDTGRRDDLVRFPFEDDLSFEAGEIRMIADK